MAYSDAPFHKRLGSLGDEAEGVFESVKPLGTAERLGWDRPNNIRFADLPFVIRHTPDYLTGSGYLVEVCGLGRDGILKSVKVDKYEALKVWQRLCPSLGLQEVALFVWNSHAERFVVVNWKAIVKLVSKAKRVNGVQSFSDGNEYYPIDWEWLTQEAVFIGAWTE